jgi:hypothetical protein
MSSNENKVLVNLKEALDAAPGGYDNSMERYNGGWCKTVTALDKSHDDGYSIVGEFIRKETVTAYQPVGLFLDCDIAGSRKRHDKYYTLFELRPDTTVRVVARLNSNQKDWAIKLWPAIEKWFVESKSAEESNYRILRLYDAGGTEVRSYEFDLTKVTQDEAEMNRLLEALRSELRADSENRTKPISEESQHEA